jgi:SARP family transcriptional regulator, regulator of embCAB operon
MEGARMHASVLGPLLLERGTRVVTPTAPKPRKIISLLLLNANQVVPIASLCEELWGEQQPPSALTTLQTYILQLRRLISGASREVPSKHAREILATEAGGYVFRLQPGHLDLHAYKQLVAQGRRALAGGCWPAAAETLTSACALWRGPALADVEAGSVLQPQIWGLNESHLATVEQRIEASLHRGRHLDVLGDLSVLVAQHRYHENLHAQLMLALHRSGRRQDALEIFHLLRSRLVADLGMEPSHPLQVLQRAILCDDPTLRMPPDGDSAGLHHLGLVGDTS